MPFLIEGPTVIESAGNLPKRIEEYAGRVNSSHSSVSVARMISPTDDDLEAIDAMALQFDRFSTYF